MPAAIRDSTSTYGLRFAGEKPVGKVKLAYVVSYATQTDYADNPLDFDLDYRTEEVSATFGKFTFGVGEEVLRGQRRERFHDAACDAAQVPGMGRQVPRDTAERHRGSVLELRCELSRPSARFETLGFVVSYHDYNAERIDAYYGDELNVSLAVEA